MPSSAGCGPVKEKGGTSIPVSCIIRLPWDRGCTAETCTAHHALPGAAIAIAVVAFNRSGNGIRDTFDPRRCGSS